MTIMRHFIISILFFIPLATFGQKISFNTEILNSKDSEIIAVRDLWKSYLTFSQNGFDKPPPDYWNKYEIDQGFTDIIKASIHVPSYLIGELKVFDIKRVDYDYYRIRNIWLLGDSTYMFKFSVYAKKEDNGYKLFNSFFAIKPTLQHFKSDNFEFYYPKNHSFNNQKADKSVEFFSTISSLYGNTNKREITYIIGTNLDEANSFIGFDYTPINSPSEFAGNTIDCQNFIILSGREDHIHEIIHAVFIPMFPHGHMLFQEGVATFYGGNVDRTYSNFIDQLKKIIITKPDIDLSNINDIDKTLNNGKFNNFYFIGAIFIDYALKIGGPKKVLALFQNPVTNPYSFDDAISAIQKEFGIEKNQIDSFLKNYIQNYQDN